MELVLIVLNGWKTGDAKSQTLMQEQSAFRKFKACVTVLLFDCRGSMCILELGYWSFMRACLLEKSSY